ncbi:hypothetical protein C1645_64815 [Glomus cerebriforme]|uniref:C2H2-type domain-containing protein n=1 Tax=Glomus cerebriforme TaxID=658196 RepID=A0A397T1Z9_9GLOM|nr:hypothetical protein C1645_64815 [Glomus cerebriforme]
MEVGKVNIHSTKDTIQNDVMEEASASHADTTAPPNAASLQQISKVENPLRNQLAEQQVRANTSKNEGSITTSTTVMPLAWIDEDKTNLSNSTITTVTTQKEPSMTEALVQNLPTSVSSATSSTTHDINMMTPNMKNLNAPGQYTTDSANFPSSSTPLDSSSGTFNQFSVNTDKTTPGQQNNPNAAKAKPFVCNVCNQTFSRQHNLKSHALTHSQEKPFQCDICHHFFRRHHDLKRHAKLHTGEKPYQCEHCKRKFARLDALNRHLRAESFCGGPQKKLFQNSESKLEPSSSQQPLQPPPQQPVPQSQQSIQPQTKPQLDQKQNSQQTPAQLQQQQYKQSVEDLQKKQAQNQPNNNASINKNEISFQRQQVIQEQYHPWAQQSPTQQLSQIQSMPKSNNTQSLQGKQTNIVMANQSHRQIIFPVDATTTTTANSVASHYKMQYSLNKPIQEPQRRVTEIMMTNDQEVEVHPNNVVVNIWRKE